MTRRLARAAGLWIWIVVAVSGCVRLGAEALPPKLADDEFWKLSMEFSEPSGYFQSDNLLSNEIAMQTVIPQLLKQAKSGRAYMGVGPEQNFTYIAALRPKMAFIVDIRRGNRDLQLMYKALFELSSDRADFVSRLFAKPRPASLTKTSTALDIFNAYWDIETSDVLYKQNLQAIRDQLLVTHHLPLGDDEMKGVEQVY